ncbi:MAG: hypothetical protein CFE40_13525 [Burkholderiales bacterium PBB1]|nr:MAG: hypothetical protein CFE40_13525 [Burkholderiales bacterium PBB1]
MKRIAILQSNYLPWRGYFDLMAYVDEFVFYDEVQYTKGDWRNRNRIKTPHGLQWLTVPVRFDFRHRTPVCDIEIAGDRWRAAHWKSIMLNHARAPHAAAAAALLAPLYVGEPSHKLSDWNRHSIAAIAQFLGIGTRLADSTAYPSASADPTQRLVDICVQSGATHYVSGPAARAYLRESAFAECGLAVEWFGYDGYPPYPQLWGEFEARVSVIDLLFNCGHHAARYLRHTHQD